jgi:hypothetical protein
MLNEDADYLCPSVSRSALLCPENHIKRGTKRGTKEDPNIGCRTIETKRSRMKTTKKHKQVGDTDGFDEGTYGLEVCNESFASSNKLVLTKTNERALAAGGTQ